MFASAVATASLGLALLRRRERAALLTGERLTYGARAGPAPPRRRQPAVRHRLGVADACPAPIAAQLGQGVPWAVFTLTGVAFGVWLFGVRSWLLT